MRSQLLMGRARAVLPGWDCHGLPIEQQVEKQVQGQGQAQRRASSAQPLRGARAEVRRRHAHRVQAARLPGHLGRPLPDAVARTTRRPSCASWRRSRAAGLLYRDKKPVHWCVTHRTALAEAEVEYAEHTSPSIYVRFPVEPRPGRPRSRSSARPPAAFVIWTTTPWTLPANLAVVANPELDYVGIPVDRRGQTEYLVVAQGLAEAFLAACGLTAPARRAVDPDLAATRLASLRGNALPATPSSPSRGPSATTACGSRATPRWRRAPAWCTRPPATAPTTTSSAATHGLEIYAPVDAPGRFTPTRSRTGRAWACSRPTRRSSQHLADAGFLLEQAGRDDPPPVPALLALQEADHLPRHGAVVRAPGRGRRRPQPARARAGRDRRTTWIPAWGATASAA